MGGRRLRAAPVRGGRGGARLRLGLSLRRPAAPLFRSASAPVAARAAALRALQDRLRTRLRIRYESRHHFLRDLALDEPFDVVQEIALIDADERNGLSGRARATRPAD